MNILVTGATGLLGAECVRVFSRRNRVSGLARHKPDGVLEGLESFEVCDIGDRSQVERVVRLLKPNAIIHTAAIANVDRCEREPETAHRINVEGTEHIARAASSHGCRLIFISTDYVFDGKAEHPYREEDSTHPINAYGRTKLQAEKTVLRYVADAWVVRTCWLFGRKGSTFIRKVLNEAVRKEPLSFIADKFASPTHVHDLACALDDLLTLRQTRKQTSARTGTVHITNAGGASWYEFAQCILAAAGKAEGLRLARISQKDLAMNAARPAMTVLNNARFQMWTDRKMRPWQEAVRECVVGLTNTTAQIDR